MPLSTEEREYAKMLYEENAEHARLHEELRGSATTLFVSLIAGLLAATAFGEPRNISHRWIGGIICAVSLLGALLSAKHYERFQLHLRILRECRHLIEEDLLNKSLKKLRESARVSHESEHLLHRVRLNVLWLLVYGATFIIGLALIFGHIDA